MILMDSQDDSSTTSKDLLESEGEVDDGLQYDESTNEASKSRATPTEGPQQTIAAKRSSTKPRKKYKKAPGAPKRFRSAFILFSQFKHKEIQSMLAEKGDSEKTTSVAKMVSEEWRNMNAEERSKWDEMAAMDRDRFDKEKMRYRGPWTVPIGHRRSKDPTAPKRPASAFLSFSNSRRAAVKQENKQASNAEISKILSDMWKEAPEDLKKQYTDREAVAREEYKKKMAEWKVENEKNKKAKKDPLELFQENEKERKRKGLASDEEDGYDSSDAEERRKKRRKGSRKVKSNKTRDVETPSASSAPQGVQAEGNTTNNLVHAFLGNVPQTHPLAPQLFAQAPWLSSLSHATSTLITPASLTIPHLHQSRALPTFTNSISLPSGLSLSQIPGFPGTLGANLNSVVAGLQQNRLSGLPVVDLAQPIVSNNPYQTQMQPQLPSQEQSTNQNQQGELRPDQQREQEFIMQLLAARQRNQHDQHTKNPQNSPN